MKYKTDNNQVTIKIYDVVKTKSPMTEEDGKKIYKKIESYKESNSDKKLIINFENIESATTAVINNSIAILVKNEGIEQVASYLRLRNVKNDLIKTVINLSLELAQEKYELKNRISRS